MLLFFVGLLGCAPEDNSPQPVQLEEEKSLYALDAPLISHIDVAGFDQLRGHPTIFSMFYTTCPQACPLLIQDIQAIESELSEVERSRLRVMLVSMDPAHDHQTALTGVILRHHLDDRWRLGVVPEIWVRPVAAALGVKYRPLPEGGFAHTSVLTLVDGEGVIRARSEADLGRSELMLILHQLLSDR